MVGGGVMLERKVEPRRLAQVWHQNGKCFYVLESALDSGLDYLDTYTRTGTLRVSRRHTMPISREYLIFPASEPVTLADGAADQSLIPGVAPVPLSARQLEAERNRREQRQGHAPLPCGGLWDETAQRQGSLF